MFMCNTNITTKLSNIILYSLFCTGHTASEKLFLLLSFHAGWRGNYPPRHSMLVGSTTVAWNLLLG